MNQFIWWNTKFDESNQKAVHFLFIASRVCVSVKSKAKKFFKWVSKLIINEVKFSFKHICQDFLTWNLLFFYLTFRLYQTFFLFISFQSTFFENINRMFWHFHVSHLQFQKSFYIFVCVDFKLHIKTMLINDQTFWLVCR